MSTATIVIAIIMVLVAIGGIVYQSKNKGKSTGKSAPDNLAWKATTAPVTPSMSNPTADPAKETKTVSLADVAKKTTKKK